MTLQELNNLIGAVATVLGIVGTLARAIPAQTWARWERDLPRVANSLRFARAVGPDVLKALRAAWAVLRGTPWGARVAPAVDAVDAALPRETQAPPPPSDPQRGAVRVGALLAICGGVLLATLAGAVLTGCPRPRDCTPASQRCEGDTPVICDGEGRSWRASGDPIVTCAQVGGVCLVRDGRAFCGRAPADAGAASDGGAL